MGLVYDRSETEQEIIIVLKYNALRLWLALALVVVLLIPDLMIRLVGSDLMYFAVSLVRLALPLLYCYLAFIILYSIATIGVRTEIRRAMRKGLVVVSGSGRSFKHPLIYKIKK